MAQISKRMLRYDIQKRVWELFFKSFCKIRSEEQATKFLDDLLTPTEKTNLAKRLSIAFLLYQGYDQRLVADLLKTSTSTVNKVGQWMRSKGEGFRWVIQKIQQEEGIREFLDAVEDIFSSWPSKGRNWSRWRKEQYAKERQRSKPF